MDYHINIFYSEEDRGYIADIPGFKRYSAFGETPGKALQELEIVKKAWLETAQSENTPLPLLKCRPIIYQIFQWALPIGSSKQVIYLNFF